MNPLQRALIMMTVSTTVLCPDSAPAREGPLPYQDATQPVDVRVDGVLQTLDLSSGSARVAATRDDIVIVDPTSKLLRALPHLDAWQQSREAREPQRVAPVVSGDPCLPPQ